MRRRPTHQSVVLGAIRNQTAARARRRRRVTSPTSDPRAPRRAPRRSGFGLGYCTHRHDSARAACLLTSTPNNFPRKRLCVRPRCRDLRVRVRVRARRGLTAARRRPAGGAARRRCPAPVTVGTRAQRRSGAASAASSRRAGRVRESNALGTEAGACGELPRTHKPWKSGSRESLARRGGTPTAASGPRGCWGQPLQRSSPRRGHAEGAGRRGTRCLSLFGRVGKLCDSLGGMGDGLPG